MFQLLETNQQSFEPNDTLMNRLFGLALVNFVLSLFAQLLTQKAKAFTLDENDPQSLEKFYKEWTFPVKVWALDYTVGILYACVMVYMLMKASTADEHNSGVFN